MKSDDSKPFFELTLKARKVGEQVKIKIDITVDDKEHFIEQAIDLAKGKFMKPEFPTDVPS